MDMGDELGGEPMALDRVEKGEEELPTEELPTEAFESRNYSVQVESIKGTKGTKFFESKHDALGWFHRNKSKIHKIKFIK